MLRRDLLRYATAILTLCACGDVTWAGEGGHSAFKPGRKDAVDLPPERWRSLLKPLEYKVLREAGTEYAFSGDLHQTKADGIYVCAGCGLPLFDSTTKFDSGTGWPSFFAPLAQDRVADRSDMSIGMVRTENLCNRCGGHLGHVFRDGPRPTGLRYCMNSAALDFVPRDQAAKLAGEPVLLGGYEPEAGGGAR
jgi:peptide-methionine (R)-S-oxide reductase